MEKLNVKVGDNVIHEYMGNECIATVIKITLTGKIRIDCSTNQFNQYGAAIGYSGQYPCPYIRKATPEDIKRIEQKEVILKAYDLCHTVETKKISYEKALKIIEILGDESNEQLA